MGVWSGATDDFDSGLDRPLEFPGLGAAAIYHANDPNAWAGPTAFYVTDYRAPMAPDESKTWSPIHLWATPGAYGDDTMTLLIQGAADVTPPPNRTYTLELLYVPPGVTGAPPVGTTWDVPPDEPFTVTVPTFATDDGREGYQFALTVGAVACPGDIDGDGVVDLSDLAVLISSYGLCAGETGFVRQADFTGDGDHPDGCVDLADLALLLSNYGCGSPP